MHGPHRLSHSRAWTFLAFLLACGFGSSRTAAATDIAPQAPRLSEIQVLGSHNSYHVAPHPAVLNLIRARDPKAAASIEYTHPPITDQLERLGLRQLELDLYADPEGARFAQPAGASLAGIPGPSNIHMEALRAPGTKILHVPDVDYQTRVISLRTALQEIVAWSVRRPAHAPIFVLLELKQEAADARFPAPLPWTAALLRSVEQEIRDTVPAKHLLRPDDVRGAFPSLRDAILQRGWPSLTECRGRLVFLLDNTDARRDLLVQDNPSLAGRLIFPSVEPGHPAAAWFKINDPVAQHTEIQALVRQGFLVRTRADADLALDPARREAALSSGAQMVSTDFAESIPALGDFQVSFPSRSVVRPNPLRDTGRPIGIDLEDLALPGIAEWPWRELDLLNRRAMAHHQRRELGAASRDYSRLLAHEPPVAPTPAQRNALFALAPELKCHPEDPFQLRDVVALHHPTQPCVAFHLFWEDDLDFPEDNDPADHEVLWITYDPATVRANRIFTYFHGHLLEVATSRARPRVAVEWGKHGSLPIDDTGSPVLPLGLEQNWRQLHTHGIRLPDHPLARTWPKRFDGNWTEYRRYTRSLATSKNLRQSGLLWTTRWANATLDQYALAYNFAAKTEWPPAIEPERELSPPTTR